MKEKVINFKEKQEEVYEVCQCCKCLTTIRRDTPIQERIGYIEGAGQVCLECYKEIQRDQI